MSNVVDIARKYNAAEALRSLANNIDAGEFDPCHIVIGLLEHGGKVSAFGMGVHADRALEGAGIAAAVQAIILQGDE